MIRRPPTLFARLLLLTLPVEAVVLGFFAVWLIRGTERRAEDLFDLSLAEQRSELMRRAVFDREGRLQSEIHPGVLAPGTMACILNGRGAVLWQHPSGWLEKSGLRPTSHAGLEYTISVKAMGSEYRVLDAAHRLREPEDTEPYVATGPLVEAIVAAPLSALNASNRKFRAKAAATGVALLLFSGLLLWGALKAGLSPIGILTGRLHHIPGPEGMERLDARTVPREIRPLAFEINALLDRLWGLVELEKRFTAEAAHEFRTPLTIMKSTLQTALLTARSEADHANALKEALEDLERLERTAESLLAMARDEALRSEGSVARTELPLPEIMSSLAESFSAMARERSLTMALECEPCTVPGERTSLEHLFANLVDNAVKYSKAGGRIVLRCGADEGGAFAAVEDDGPPIPEEDRASLFRHFFRGAAGRAARTAGAGLGLSIAAEIARLHGASLTHEPCGAEGNRFAVRFGKR